MISQLRNTIAHFTAEERQRTLSVGGRAGAGTGLQDQELHQEVEEVPLRPHEQKLINYIVNDYLVRQAISSCHIGTYHIAKVKKKTVGQKSMLTSVTCT
jgi:hypothetical protein